MAQDDLGDYRTVGDIALRVLPEKPDVLMLEIRTKSGPFRFGISQDMAVKVADQITGYAKLLRPRRQNYPE